MRINRFTAWGIIIADVIIISLLILYLSDYVSEYLWLLFLQLFVIVVILWKSLWVARLAREEKSLTNWQAVGIGTLVSIVPLILLIILALMDLMNSGGNPSSILSSVFFFINIFIIFFSPGVPFGIAGALAGKHWKKTRRAVSIGAIFGAVFGTGVWWLLLNIMGQAPNWG